MRARWRGRRGGGPALLLAALLLASGCGYQLAARGTPLAGGVGPMHVTVRPFENRTGDSEAGAFVAAAVREELARRGGEGGSEARLEGVVEDSRASPSSPNGATWRLGLTVWGKLADGTRTIAEARVVREEEFLAGQDPLETEGRRRLALRRAAQAAARDLVERFEAP